MVLIYSSVFNCILVFVWIDWLRSGCSHIVLIKVNLIASVAWLISARVHTLILKSSSQLLHHLSCTQRQGIGIVNIVVLFPSNCWWDWFVILTETSYFPNQRLSSFHLCLHGLLLHIDQVTCTQPNIQTNTRHTSSLAQHLPFPYLNKIRNLVYTNLNNLPF